MDSLNNLFQELYKNFNDRKIDVVISKMTDKVKWANGMDGGYIVSFPFFRTSQKYKIHLGF